MKKILFVTVAVLFSSFSFSQLTLKEIVSTKTIVEERVIKLNGGFRSSFGGSSRIAIPVSLPLNTVEWYYSITTFPDNESLSEKLNLTMQLAAAIATSTAPGKAASFLGLDESVIQALKIPQGSIPIDAHVLDALEAAKFENKKDQFLPMNSAERITQALVRLNSPLTKSGLWYLGLKNLSSTSAVKIKIEIVAIIKEKKWVSE